MDSYGSEGRFRKLSVGELRVDRRYQRGERLVAARRITRSFLWSRFGVPVVSRRKGAYFVVDGQHRVVAASLLKLEKVPCLVFEGLPVKGEADAFVSINGVRRKVSPVTMFKAELMAEHSLSVATQKTLVRYRYRANSTKKKSNGGFRPISAVGLAKGLQQRDLLADTLHVLTACWPESDLCSSALVIRALGSFIGAYKSHENPLSVPEMEKKLKAWSLEKIHSRARGTYEMSSQISGHSFAKLLARTFITLYNKGLRGQRRMNPDDIRRIRAVPSDA